MRPLSEGAPRLAALKAISAVPGVLSFTRIPVFRKHLLHDLQVLAPMEPREIFACWKYPKPLHKLEVVNYLFYSEIKTF